MVSDQNANENELVIIEVRVLFRTAWFRSIISRVVVVGIKTVKVQSAMVKFVLLFSRRGVACSFLSFRRGLTFRWVCSESKATLLDPAS
jgi:hypothetical protein